MVLVEHTTTDIAAFLEQPPSGGADPAVVVFTAPQQTLVLGSRQPDDIVDCGVAGARGVRVVRRRSGGGAVLVDPDHALWIDVLLPRGHPLWIDDVRRSPHWLGDCWNQALDELGVTGEVHRGGLEETPWGSLVCFAAIGPGEVTVDDYKVVGISQRRTREGARFQCLVYDRWDADPLIHLLRLHPHERDRARKQLGTVAAGPGVELADLCAAFLNTVSGALG